MAACHVGFPPKRPVGSRNFDGVCLGSGLVVKLGLVGGTSYPKVLKRAKKISK